MIHALCIQAPTLARVVKFYHECLGDLLQSLLPSPYSELFLTDPVCGKEKKI
jgi:hypothetical protein